VLDHDYFRDLLFAGALLVVFALALVLADAPFCVGDFVVALDFAATGLADDEFFAAFAAGFGCTVASPRLTSAVAFSAAFGTASVAVHESRSAAASRLRAEGLMFVFMARVSDWCLRNAISCSTRCTCRPVSWPESASLP